MADADKQRYQAPAAACAAQILRRLSQAAAPLTLATIVRDIDCTKSLAFRVIRELERADLVARAEPDGYRLGLGALELGAAVISLVNYSEYLQGALKNLTQRTGETTNVAVLRDAEVLFVFKEQAPKSLVSISHVGQRLPANCSALGKMLMAEMSDEEIRERFRLPLPRLTAKSTTDMDQLLEEVRIARANGYAIDRESAILGLCAVAIPIRIHQLLPESAALSVTTDAESFDSRASLLLDSLMETRKVIEQGHSAYGSYLSHATPGIV